MRKSRRTVSKRIRQNSRIARDSTVSSVKQTPEEPIIRLTQNVPTQGSEQATTAIPVEVVEEIPEMETPDTPEKKTSMLNKVMKSLTYGLLIKKVFNLMT